MFLSMVRICLGSLLGLRCCIVDVGFEVGVVFCLVGVFFLFVFCDEVCLSGDEGRGERSCVWGLMGGGRLGIGNLLCVICRCVSRIFL